MIALPMRVFQEISLALPKCKITTPKEQVSYILDKDNEKIGDINWETLDITIYEEYQYCNQVIESIGKDKFIDARKDFEYDTDDYDASEGVPDGVISNMIIPD